MSSNSSDHLALLSPAATRFLEHAPLRMLIGGELVPARGGETISVEDPATGLELSTVPAGKAEDVDLAVLAARQGFAAWNALSAADRARRLYAVADLIEECGTVLAELDSLDSGKPVAGARAYDIPNAVSWFRYFAGWPTKIEGATIPGPVGRLIYTKPTPVGVVGQIIPWNFPFMMVAWKLAPALAAGCTCVLKPAEETPLSALYFADELTKRELLPPGVVNIVTGYGETAGAALVSHPGISKISFTGSRETAHAIVQGVSQSLKRVTLELGGKSPNIVLADVDAAAVAAEVSNAAFLNQGENCCAGTRLFVHKDRFDEVVDAVAAHSKTFTLGPGLDESTSMGPLVSRAQHQRVASYIKGANDGEGDMVAGGELSVPGYPNGYFVRPTIFTGVRDDDPIATDEIFGPVLVVLPFETLEEVAARANRTEFGLAAGVWTRDIAAAHTLASLLDAGTVWINTYNETDPAVPFGGFKASGWGREHGRESLDQYLETKAIWVNLNPVV